MEENKQEQAYDVPRPAPVEWTQGGIALLWNAVQNWDEEGE